MAFIAMLALQVAGALVLLLNNINGSREAVIRSCFPGSNTVKRDNDNNCVLPCEKLQRSAHAIYLNIVAFFDLVIGYGIAAFSPACKYPQFMNVALVIVSSVLLTIAEFYLCKVAAKFVYSKDRTVSYDELEKFDVETFATDREFDEMLDGVFGAQDDDR